VASPNPPQVVAINRNRTKYGTGKFMEKALLMLKTSMGKINRVSSHTNNEYGSMLIFGTCFNFMTYPAMSTTRRTNQREEPNV